ncbi:MAG: PDR/VanB family oxidoreductase [Roseovarius sp.]
MSSTIEVVVTAISEEAPRIKAFELAKAGDGELPAFDAGSHIVVELDGIGQRRAYSLANPPGETHRYLIAVLREVEGAGSCYMHDEVTVGTRLRISPPENSFALDPSARSTLLIAGGIGITPMMAMVHQLEAQGARYHLYYCARSPDHAAFLNDLSGERSCGEVTFVYDCGDPSRGLDLAPLLRNPAPGAHLYVCGPASLITAVREGSSHWPKGSVHYELFASLKEPAETGDADTAFEIEIEGTGEVLTIPENQSILEVLLEHGYNVPHLCQEGYCGSCLTPVLDGIPDHRDEVLDEDERNANDVMTICCSRARTKRLKLDI